MKNSIKHKHKHRGKLLAVTKGLNGKCRARLVMKRQGRRGRPPKES